LQLWNVFDCAYFSVVSSVAPLQDSNNWGGSHQVNRSFLIPYIVKQAGVPVPSASVGVANVILQNQMGRGQGGGSGFEGLLTEGVDYIVHQQATTDANGLGFLNINFTRSGSFMLFWNLSAGSDTDAAGFDSGTFVEVRNFDAYGQPAASVPKVLRLQNASNGSAGGSPSGNWTAIDYYGTGLNLTIFNLTQINAGFTQWFIGSFNESANGTLANEGGSNAFLSTWYFAWNPASNVIVLDDDNNFTRVQGAQNDGPGDNYTVMQSSLNDSICLASGSCGDGALQLKAMRAFNNWTNSTFGSAANYSLVAFVQETSGSSGTNNFEPASSTSNVTGKVCAQSFGKPGTPIQNANVTFFIQQWGMNGQRTQNLTAYDPLNDTEVTVLPTGPLGCIAAKIKAPGSPNFAGGWPQGGQGGGPGEIRATIYNGTSMESSWVGMVQFFG
ncbi:MAG: hypothetical protein V1708_04855, partial [Candidatus Micrarchaeota archaeon]